MGLAGLVRAYEGQTLAARAAAEELGEWDGGWKRLGILEHVLEPDVGVSLHRGAEAFERDVVQAAVHVAAAGVALGRAVVRGGVPVRGV